METKETENELNFEETSRNFNDAVKELKKYSETLKAGWPTTESEEMNKMSEEHKEENRRSL